MAKYRFNLFNKGNINDFNNLYSYLGIMNKNDDLIIALGQHSDSDLKYICDMLRQKDYEISVNKKEENNEISVRKFE
ncbi:MAG: hypothetical protein FWC47_01980 [Oscillospiraceae bacterium]|nr:hypothetical protein [Oscillospiraceae bacterium]